MGNKTDYFNFTFGSERVNNTVSIPTAKLFLDANTSSNQKVCLLGIQGQKSLTSYVFGGVFLREVLVHMDFSRGRLGLSAKVNLQQKEKEDRIALGIGIFIGVIGIILIIVVIGIRLNTNKKKLRKSLAEEEAQRLKSELL